MPGFNPEAMPEFKEQAKAAMAEEEQEVEKLTDQNKLKEVSGIVKAENAALEDEKD